MSDARSENPICRSDARFGTRYMLGNTVYVLPGAVAFYFAWRSFPEAGWPLWVSVGEFLGCVAFGFWFERRRLRNYRCPECGRHTPHPVEQMRPGVRLRYYCPDCNVEWDASIIGATD